MRILNRLAGMLTRSGREDALLLQGIEHAKAKRPERAIEIYNSLLGSKTTSDILRARVLFNRALAYSSLEDDDKARADLEQVLTLRNLPENVQTAARAQLARIKRRSEE
jgi:lipoprotein NlpI